MTIPDIVLGTLSDVTKRRKDVDQEYVLFYHVMDENKSWHIEDNLLKIPTNVSEEILEDEDFMVSSVNYLFLEHEMHQVLRPRDNFEPGKHNSAT